MIEVSNPRPGIRWANITPKNGVYKLTVHWGNGVESESIYNTEIAAKIVYGRDFQPAKFGYPRPKWAPCKS